jgi:hypothetical protein
MLYGKPVSEYLRFQRVVLIAIVVVGLVKLGLSAAGVPASVLKWVPLNIVLWAGVFYYGVAVHTKGFGSYKQLLPLVFFQLLPMQTIAVLGILLAIAGVPNIFAAPEFSPMGGNQWLHAAAHLTIGIVVPTFLCWGVASLTMFITKKVSRRPAYA